MDFRFHPIDVISSKHTRPEETPIQPAYAPGPEGCVEVFPQYEGGLRDLKGFSHIHLLYPFHRAGTARLLVTPFLDDCPRGVFATRAPSRPNAIGTSLVRLIERDGRTLHIHDVDILDGTPPFDIKPYIDRFDVRTDAPFG